MIEINLEGITNQENEPRIIAYLDVTYNGEVFKWPIYIPLETPNIGEYIESVKPSIESQIIRKEAEWNALDPKTKTIDDPFMGQITVPIEKSEIIRPDFPDYVAKRRNAYPSVGEQLDAFWKGNSSEEYKRMFSKIDEVKEKFPKEMLELDQKKIEKCMKVKMKARLVILSVFPEWKQTNMTARAIELLSNGDLEGPEWGHFRVIWDWIKSVRSYSDSIEQSIMNCTTEEQVKAIEFDTGWPEWQSQ